MPRLRVAVIGAGMAFEPHARSLLEAASEVEVACLVAPSAATREKVAQRFGFPVSASVETVWNDQSIQAVLILTPPNTHFALVDAASAAGKHILLEKPLDTSTERAQDMVEQCERRQVMLGVVLQHRFRQSALELRGLLQRGELGQLVSMSVQIPWWRPQSYYDMPGRGTRERDGGGVLLTQAIHTIDLALSLGGPAESVFAHALTSPVHQMETEDLVAAAFRFANGAAGSLYATTACYPGFSEQILLAGTKGSATLQGDSLQVHLMDGRSIEYGTAAVLGGGADPMAFSHQHHLALLRSFVHSVSSGAPLIVGGREALHVQHFIDAILDSSRLGALVEVKPA